MDEWTTKNIAAYDRNAVVYAQKTMHLSMESIINRFLSYLQGTYVLSIGCGPGKDEKVLKEKGLSVCGIDLSERMLEEARRNVPNTAFCKMDMRKLEFMTDTFDGIYCTASLLLLHRMDVGKTLNGMNHVLRKNGALYLSVKEGTDEIKRWVGPEIVTQTLFTNSEMQELLFQARFEVLECYRTENKANPDMPWLNYFCRNTKT